MSRKSTDTPPSQSDLEDSKRFLEGVIVAVSATLIILGLAFLLGGRGV